MLPTRTPFVVEPQHLTAQMRLLTAVSFSNIANMASALEEGAHPMGFLTGKLTGEMKAYLKDQHSAQLATIFEEASIVERHAFETPVQRALNRRQSKGLAWLLDNGGDFHDDAHAEAKTFTVEVQVQAAIYLMYRSDSLDLARALVSRGYGHLLRTSFPVCQAVAKHLGDLDLRLVAPHVQAYLGSVDAQRAIDEARLQQPRRLA